MEQTENNEPTKKEDTIITEQITETIKPEEKPEKPKKPRKQLTPEAKMKRNELLKDLRERKAKKKIEQMNNKQQIETAKNEKKDKEKKDKEEKQILKQQKLEDLINSKVSEKIQEYKTQKMHNKQSSLLRKLF